MNIDLDEKETQALLCALRMYMQYRKDQDEELEKFMANEKISSGEYYLCCLNEEEKIPYYRCTIFYTLLRDKLKQFQMTFPLEEHPSRQYNYGKKFGKMNNREDITWLLRRVKTCVEETKRRKELKSCGWGSSRSYIFMGSYDVWFNEADGPMYNQIMNDRINEARNLGLIINESGEKEWKLSDNWFLTPVGEKYLEKNV